MAAVVCGLAALWLLGGCGDASQPADTDASSSGKPSPVEPRPAEKKPLVRPGGLLPEFTDIAAEAGLTFQRDDDMRGQHRILEANGGGVALFDYDGDGRLDVLLTGGCRLPLVESDAAPTLALFRNLGNGRFERATLPAGLERHAYFYGCTAGDFNDDGFDDLYVTAFGRNTLWQNNGDGTFSDVTDRARVACGGWGSSAAFGDFNADGVLDLYATRYIEYSATHPRLCPDPQSPDKFVQCSPTLFHGTADVLLVGDGSGGFRDVTRQAGITGLDGKGLGVVVFDADLDGRPDIFVANDGVPNFLYLNRTPASPSSDPGAGPRAPAFEERGMLLGVAVNALGKAQGSMGIACGDYDGDGRPDLYVTNFHSESNTLYRNGAEGFSDVTPGSGTGATSRLMVGWGTEFRDFDNDGWLDLYAVNGHVDDFSWRKEAPEAYQMPPQLFRNERNGRFVDVSHWAGPYFREKWLGRGAATGDLDDDGDLDLVVSHQRSPIAVLRNDTKTGHRSVQLKLVGTGRSNRSAFGARVEAGGLGWKLVREVIGGGSYQSCSDRRVHIGLGKRDAVPRLTVRWPSGRTETFPDVKAGTYAVVEGRGIFPVGASR